MKDTIDSLDAVFGALADPTRRAMLEQLARGTCSIGTLSEPFEISAPGISKHLRVLEQSGLITRTKIGRETYCQLTRKPFADAHQWLGEHQAFWEQQFDALEEYLKEDQWSPQLRAQGASHSNSRAASPRRPGGSSTPGRRRKR